jgi:hypothetical protein
MVFLRGERRARGAPAGLSIRAGGSGQELGGIPDEELIEGKAAGAHE